MYNSPSQDMHNGSNVRANQGRREKYEVAWIHTSGILLILFCILLQEWKCSRRSNSILQSYPKAVMENLWFHCAHLTFVRTLFGLYSSPAFLSSTVSQYIWNLCFGSCTAQWIHCKTVEFRTVDFRTVDFGTSRLSVEPPVPFNSVVHWTEKLHLVVPRLRIVNLGLN